MIRLERGEEMNKTKDITEETLIEVLKEWGIEGVPISIYPTTWDINQSYILKVYEEPEALQRNVITMKTLRGAGVLVPEIMELPDGKAYVKRDDYYYILTTKLQGESAAKPSLYSNNWFFYFGTILAKLHVAFLECEKHVSYWDNSLLEEMNGWVKKNLTDYKTEYLEESEVQEAIDELAAFYEDLPRQLIHRDVNLGNFLFQKGEFSGYIDFDLSQKNIRIFDLCYVLLGLLLEEDGLMEAHRWYEIIRQVVRGYDSVGILNKSEKRAFASVMKNIELLFAAYFLGLGESELAKNAVNLFYFVKRNEEKILSACNTQL